MYGYKSYKSNNYPLLLFTKIQNVKIVALSFE